MAEITPHDIKRLRRRGSLHAQPIQEITPICRLGKITFYTGNMMNEAIAPYKNVFQR
jgi:hypothetical protein